MFERIKTFIKQTFNFIVSFVNDRSRHKASFTDGDKYQFVKFLLRGQSAQRGTGFALRHVDSDKIKNANLAYGFTGDAVSFSITKHILSAVLKKPINVCSIILLPTDQMSLAIDDKEPFIMDLNLAVKIFDCLHEKILQFIGQNFSGKPRHFLFIKDMDGAAHGYDFQSYSTGKCGKQRVEASQILKVFSKNSWWKTKDSLLAEIERGILQLDKPTHSYSEESTRSILTILREIHLNADEDQLTIENVNKRLIESEYQNKWSTYKYESIYAKNGSLAVFKEKFADVTDDLGYFRGLL